MRKKLIGRILSLTMALAMALSVLTSGGVLTVGAMTADQAQEAMDAFLSVYYKEDEHRFYKFSDNPQNGGEQTKETDFWVSGVLWDTLNDAYEATGDEKYATMIHDVYEGFLNNEHVSWGWDVDHWTENTYNDDLCWWAQAAARAYTLTDNSEYLELATEMYEKVYSHWDETFLDGGILWRMIPPEENQKNVATNANAAIVAARLSKIYADTDPEKSAAYEEQALRIYNWTKENLYLGNGEMLDNIQFNGQKNNWKFSYNNGLFAGASYELYTLTGDESYMDTARLCLDWVIENLTFDGTTMNDEGNGDAAAFKIVFLRQMSFIAKADPADGEKYLPFLKSNASQAYTHRRASDNLCGSNLAITPGEEDSIYSISSVAAPCLLFLSGFDDQETYPFYATFWQAEGAERSDVATGTNQSGYTGGGHIVWWNDDTNHVKDGWVNFPVKVPEDGIYKLQFRYYSRQENTRRMSVNGGDPVKLTFSGQPANQWLVSSEYVYLHEGENSIRLTYYNPTNHPNDADTDPWFFLDKLMVEVFEPYSSLQDNIYVSQTKQDDAIVTKIDNLQAEEQPCNVALALYNEEGRFMGTTIQSVSVEADGTATVSTSLADLPQGVGSYKVMVLDPSGTPLASAFSGTIQ
ncbi:hypothetical protein NIF40_07140 [[Clostridium] leptum]|nr:hypothetical protein [[Clostridium] leptum]